MAPRPPKYLDAEAKATWKRLIGELSDTTPGSLLSLEQLCVAWSKWLGARGEDSKLRWSRCCRQWAAALSLTPKSRSTPKSNANPILKLINGAE